MIHPDRTQGTDAKLANEQSLSALNELVATIKAKKGDWPASRSQRLVLHLPQGKKLNFVLRTSGGNCEHLVKTQMSSLFEAVGLPK